jgi:hypothetical protein
VGLKAIARATEAPYMGEMLPLERRWAAGILRSFARIGDEPAPISDAAYLAGYDALRVRARRAARIGLRLAVWVVTLSPIYLQRRARLFGALDVSTRTQVLEALLLHRLHPIREAAFVLKCAACLALFRDDEFRAQSGYDGCSDASPGLVRMVRPARP